MAKDKVSFFRHLAVITLLFTFFFAFLVGLAHPVILEVLIATLLLSGIIFFSTKVYKHGWQWLVNDSE